MADCMTDDIDTTATLTYEKCWRLFMAEDGCLELDEGFIIHFLETIEAERQDIMFNRITDNLYTYKSESGSRFNLKRGVIGICSNGKCWRLEVIENGVYEVIGCFVTHSDGHGCEKRMSCDRRLWKNWDEIVSTAETIVSTYD